MNYHKNFNFIKDKKLRKILILDCKEFLTCLKKNQCYKAAVVLSGGITEAILKDRARKNKNRNYDPPI